MRRSLGSADEKDRHALRSGRVAQRHGSGAKAISIFFGIVIRMFYKDHEPVHFHAEYQGQRGRFDLSGRIIAGSIGSKIVLRLIRQ